MNAFFAIASFLSLARAEVLTVSPGESIQAQIELAQPGDTVQISDGEYRQDLQTVRDGEEDKPILITGSRKAVLYGTGKENRLFQIAHDYIHVDGFVINGQHGAGDKEEDYIDKLIYAKASREPRVIRRFGTEFKSALDGLVISNMHLTSCGGECLRLRDHVTSAEIFGNTIDNCGIWDFTFGGMKAVNGESIYVGTSSNQWGDGKNNKDGPDECKYIHIHHNDLRGMNECDIKEGSQFVLIEHNICSSQLDVNSACLDTRSDSTVFRYNKVHSNDGAGVRIGGHTIGSHTYGQQAEVYGNTLHDNKKGAIKIQTGEGTHKICENECRGDDCKVHGSAADGYVDITGKCDGLMETFWVDDTKAVAVASTLRIKTKRIRGEPDDAEEAAEPDFEAAVGDKTEPKQSGKCFPVEIADINASSADGKNTAHSTVDGKALTHWSAFGKGEWLEVDFAAATMVDAVEISFLKGDKRTQSFEVAVDGKSILKDQESTGRTLALERFPFPEAVDASSVTITGNGNSNNKWNSLTELIVCGVQEKNVTTSKDESKQLCSKVEKLGIGRVGASADDGKNKPANVIDGDLKTRWAMPGPEEQDISVELEKPMTVTEIGLAVFDGDKTKQYFDVVVETEEHGWEEVVVDGESVKGNGIESYDIGIKGVSVVKIVCYGSEDIEKGEGVDSNSFTEIELYGC